MNLVKPTKQQPRTRRTRGLLAPFACLVLASAGLAHAGCANSDAVSTNPSSSSNTGASSNTGSGGRGGDGGNGGFNTTGDSGGNGGTVATTGKGGSGGTGGEGGSGNGGNGGGGGPVCEAEVCDGIDNDCDGNADNGDPGGGNSCVTNLQGVCSVGVTKCENAQIVCIPSVKPGDQAESCNGLDDNCNGVVDEEDPGGGGPCMAAAFGECKAGTQHCQNGSIKCTPGTPMPEVCDGLDNNCDGNVDEGNPGGGLQCMTGFQGICSSGITQCDGVNGVICEAAITPGLLPEACNGLDDNCNGVTDELIAQVGQPCMAAGFSGICQFGTYSCPSVAPFQLQCDHPAPGTVQETCNNKDDDCNGTIDDPAILNNMPCNTAFPGVCMAGKTLCSNGSSQCIANIQPNQQAELCNNTDDNCNGQTDEMNPNPACTQQNPNAQFVQTWSCNTGACGITLCQQGHADINQAPGDGCECATDAYATSCATAGTVAVPKGGTVNMVGKIETAGGADYLQINFTVAPVGQAYHPKVELTNSGGGQYAMDVLVSCPGTAAGCSTTGAANNENGLQVNVWEQNYNAYTAGNGCCSDNTPRAGSVRVKVYRKFANQPTCDSYQVTATNP